MKVEMKQVPGCLYGIGTGPGDPELLTLKAVRLIEASPVVAYFCRRGGRGQSRTIADAHIKPEQHEIPLVYPVTTELPHGCSTYRERIEAFFDAAAQTLAEQLEAGYDVAVLNEGDPFFYGSFMHVYLRLSDRFPSCVVPGVASPLAAAARLPKPLTMRDDILSVLPGTLPDAELRSALAQVDAAVIMKIGSRRDAIFVALTDLGLAERAWYVERASMETEIVVPLAEMPANVPYFAQIIIPGRGVRQ